jgi:zinc D-Ala-D-Ala carboxypeptidase
MKLSQHFTLHELTRSDTALRLGIDNSLPPQLTNKALETAHMMERIRTYLSELASKDVPIVVTSGYRSPALNTAIGGAEQSDHQRMMAVDFRAPAFGSAQQVCRALAPAVNSLQIGQLILEYSSWVHVSLAVPVKPQNRVITRTSSGYSLGIA